VRRGALAAVLAGTLLGAAPSVAGAAKIGVETINDQAGAGAACALREAVTAANTDAAFGGCSAGDGKDTVKLDAGTYRLTRFDPPEDGNDTGDLDLTAPAKLVGKGGQKTIIDGNGPASGERVVNVVHTSGTSELRSLAVIRGRAGGSEGDGGGVEVGDGGVLVVRAAVVADNRAANGGAIALENGRLRVFSSAISGNVGVTNGGGINSEGDSQVLVRSTTISGNSVPGFNGGGIDVAGDTRLTVEDSSISHNKADSNGGGIFTTGDTEIEILRTSIAGNDSGGGGAGVRTVSDAFSLTKSDITGNRALGDGGGLLLLSDALIQGTTIALNNAVNGAGIDASEGVTITNSTISQNGADVDGGGIFTDDAGGTVDLNAVTITANRADDDDDSTTDAGGGLRRIAGVVTAANTIIAGNTADTTQDCEGGVTSGGHNLIGDDPTAACLSAPTTGDQVDVGDAFLAPLLDNGGPTLTHALLRGSPAIGAGNPATPGSGGNSCPARDQRGERRSNCDSGAFER
jgi:Right handed beta helix region